MTDDVANFGEYASYAIVHRGEDDQTIEHRVQTSGTLSSLKEAIDDANKENPPSSAQIQELTVNDLSDLGRGVWHFYDQLKGYYELSGVADLMATAYVGGFFDKNLLQYADREFSKIEVHSGYQIYGLRHVDLAYLDRNVKKWHQINSGFKGLPAAVLLGLVATYDSAFAEFTRSLLKARPQRYSGSERQYSVADILAMGSLDDLITRVIDDEIDQQMNKSHSDQVSFFEKSFDVKIKDHYERWPDYIEIFERRNLAAHGSLVVNDRYIRNCKGAGFTGCENLKIGDKLKVTNQYLFNSLDVLIEFGILLGLAAWQKQIPSSALESFRAMVEVSFSLLQEGRAKVAGYILDYALSVKNKGATDEIIKMMTVNLAIARKMADREADIDSVLGSTDWSATGLQFRLCVAAVKEDLDEVLRILPIAKAASEIGPMAIREWPAFKWVRPNEKFQETFTEVFGEPFDFGKSVRAVAGNKDLQE